MKESVEKLFKKMKEDKEFAEKILKQTEKEEVIEIAKAEGINITLEDIDEANAMIQKSMELQQAKTEGEISEEELEQVAGGVFSIDDMVFWTASLIISGLITSAVTISGSAAASATVTATVTASQK